MSSANPEIFMECFNGFIPLWIKGLIFTSIIAECTRIGGRIMCYINRILMFTWCAQNSSRNFLGKLTSLMPINWLQLLLARTGLWVSSVNSDNLSIENGGVIKTFQRLLRRIHELLIWRYTRSSTNTSKKFRNLMINRIRKLRRMLRKKNSIMSKIL